MPNIPWDLYYRDHGVEPGLKRVAGHTDRASKSFRALKVGAGIALVAAAAAAVKFGTSSVKAYVEAETAQVKLQDAYRKFPKLADTNISALRLLNTELAKKTKFDDDATASGQAVLAQFKLTGQQITQLTPLLQDYAAKTGKDLPTAARDLGKAMLGQGRSLKAVGIDFKDTGTAGGNFDQIMRGLRTQVGGFAEKEGKSAAGQAAILKNQFGELQESAGKQLLPTLLKIGGGLLKVVGLIQDNSAVFGTLSKTVKVVFSSIAESVGVGKGSFKDFSDFIATHQEDITSAIITGGKGFVKFGIVVAKVASGGLRAFGAFADGIGRSVSFILDEYASLAHGAALAFGWLPGIGAKFLEADAKFTIFAARARGNMHDVGDGARSAADGIDRKLLPGLSKAGQGLDAMGKKAIAAARARDITAKAENRHRDALTAATAAAKTNGKTMDSNTISGRANKIALNDLVSSSQNYIGKLVATNASSKRVTDATKTARAEFVKVAVSMGVSRDRAKELAEKYFKIPKKVETKTSAPGLADVRKNVQGLDTDVNNLNSKTINLTAKYKATATKALVSFLKNVPGSQASGFVNSFGGPPRGTTPAQLNRMVGAPIVSPEDGAAGGPTVSRSIKANTSSTGAKSIRAGTRVWDDVNAAASAYVNDAAMRSVGRLGQSALSKLMVSAAATSATGSVGSYSAGMAGTIARLRAAGARSFTTYPGHHPSMGKARDVTPHNWKIANTARASKGVWYVIYRMKIASKNHGNGWRQYHPISNRGDWRHTRHIHVAWYGAGTRRARGGLAVVGERGPELVRMRGGEQVTPLARSSYARAGSGGGVGNITYNVTINAPNYLGSNSDFKRELVSMARRGDLDVIIKRAGGN